MKVYKKNQHSLFVKPFGVHDRLYLALTVFIYFDLTAPDDPLTEQELWKSVPEQLKPNPILDVGMPKPRAEVLVTGSCFAPRGSSRNASMVSVAVGTMRKELAVFGDRFWKGHAEELMTISDPLPFSEMPLTWSNAFGGKDFAENPLGKGIHPVFREDGESLVPLPNVEYPGNLIGAPSQRPAPAGLGPVDLMWPQRQKKTGTYDEKWLKERWPYFPDDMDYEFFNCAPQDQFLEGFLAGTETIQILNMHRDMPLISSRLPGLRIRCFVTKRESPGSETEIFQDVPTRMDTLWLFPAILRGVLMYRGTTEIHDEEYEDVIRIFLATEHLSDAPGTVEHYLEEQRKAMDRSVPVDMEPLERAAKSVGGMMKRIKKIPKDLDHAVKTATGKAPVMPRTPAETAATGQKVIGDSLALLDRLEAQSRDLHAQYGHLVRIDLGMFDRMRASLRAASSRVDEDLRRIEAASEQVRKSAEAAVKEGSEKLKQIAPPGALEKSGVALEMVLPGPKKVNPWHDRGFPFVVQCRKILEGDAGALKCLRDLGFEGRSIRRAWLGINTEERDEDRTLWGLKIVAGGESEGKEMRIPPGLVMPRFSEATLDRILIMPEGWQKGENLSQGHLVDGSQEAPLFYLAEEGAPVVAVGDELQALLLEQEVGDACSIVVLERPGSKPSKDAEGEIKQAEVFLVIVPEKSATGDRVWDSWIKTYPHVRPYPLPKGGTLFDARKAGVDIREWIMEVMPKDFVRRHKIAPDLPEAGKPPTEEGLTVPIPQIDVKALIDKAGQEIRGHLEKQMGGLAAMGAQLKSEMLGKAQDAVRKFGLNPDEVLKLEEHPQLVSPAQAGDVMVKKLESFLGVMKDKGTLTPELEQKVSQWMAQIKKMSEDAQVRYDQGMARLEEAKKTAAKAKAQEMPEAAKAKFKKLGMDPDRMVPRTREEVIEMHGKGESLSFAKLSGVDLSNLDLRGIDLRQAQCQKANFAGSNLDGADLTQVMAMEADFTGASLKESTLDKAMFIKTKLGKASLSGAKMSQATFKDADLSGADFSGANLSMTTIMGTAMVETKFHGISAHLSVFSDANAGGSDFGESHLDRCLFRRLALDAADFSRVTLPSTMFMEVKGRGVTFYGGNMHKGRMSNKTELPGADIRDVVFTQGSLRETDLSGSDFTGTCLDGALLEKCDLQGARLYGVSAKTCRFSKSNLEGADMRFMNLFCGSLRKSRLVNADLRGANLFAVDFYKSVMGGTQLEGANVKRSLLFRRVDLLKSDGRVA
ncbi:MAG: DUF2169 domain-containing protein [Deltaproteobacteria bacterium]|nr:DUF2169 domain-containing protein [Deltaproteobacteria bacterium]